MQYAGTKCVRTCIHLLSQAGQVGFGSGGRTEHSSLGSLNNSAPALGRELRRGWPDRASQLSLERREQQSSAVPYESFHRLKGELQTKVGFLSFY